MRAKTQMRHPPICIGTRVLGRWMREEGVVEAGYPVSLVAFREVNYGWVRIRGAVKQVAASRA